MLTNQILATLGVAKAPQQLLCCIITVPSSFLGDIDEYMLKTADAAQVAYNTRSWRNEYWLQLPESRWGVVVEKCNNDAHNPSPFTFQVKYGCEYPIDSLNTQYFNWKQRTAVLPDFVNPIPLHSARSRPFRL